MTFTSKQVRAMINMMNKSQRRKFTLSLYKNILKDANKLKYRVNFIKVEKFILFSYPIPILIQVLVINNQLLL